MKISSPETRSNAAVGSGGKSRPHVSVAPAFRRPAKHHVTVAHTLRRSAKHHVTGAPALRRSAKHQVSVAPGVSRRARHQVHASGGLPCTNFASRSVAGAAEGFWEETGRGRQHRT